MGARWLFSTPEFVAALDLVPGSVEDEDAMFGTDLDASLSASSLALVK